MVVEEEEEEGEEGLSARECHSGRHAQAQCQREMGNDGRPGARRGRQGLGGIGKAQERRLVVCCSFGSPFHQTDALDRAHAQERDGRAERALCSTARQK